MERKKVKSQTMILKNDINPNNYSYVPQRVVDDNNQVRYLNENGNEIHSLNHLEKNLMQRKETLQIDPEHKYSIPPKYTPLNSVHPIRITNSNNITPIGSHQDIKINFFNRQPTANSNIFQKTFAKGFLAQNSMAIEDSSFISPQKQTNNIFSKGNDINQRSSSEIIHTNVSPEKSTLPTLTTYNKSFLNKQIGSSPAPNLHNMNLIANNQKLNIVQNSINIRNTGKSQTRITPNNMMSIPINGNASLKLSSMNFNPNQFLIQKTTTNFNEQSHKLNKGQERSISPLQNIIFGQVPPPIKLDLREALKMNQKKHIMNEQSPTRQSLVDFNDSRQDQYISMRHSSLTHIEVQDEAKSPLGNGNQKKLISMQTSNARLPLSVVNQIKNQKRPNSRQIQSQDQLPSSFSDFKLDFKNGFRNAHIEKIILQQKQADSQHNDDSQSRVDSMRTIRDNKEINEKQSYFHQDYANSPSLNPQTSYNPILQNEELLENKSTKFEQTQEQKNFQNDFLIKIRRKNQNRYSQKIQSLQEKLNDEEEELGFKNKEQEEIFDKKVKQNEKLAKQIKENSLDTKQIIDDDTSTQNRAQKVIEISEDFKKLLQHDIGRSDTVLCKNYLFFLGDINPKVFIDGVVFLFQNALNVSLTNNYDVKKKKFNYKIHEKFYNIIRKIFRVKILTDRYQFNEAQIDRFEYLLERQYEDLQLKPKNLLEILGGQKKCQFLINDFYFLVHNRLELKDQMPDKQIQEIGLAFLMNDDVAINNFITNLKKTKRILDKDLYCVKHSLYHFLYVEKDGLFDEDMKKSFLFAFEKFRYKYFTTYLSADTDQISKDILKYFLTKKPILEYFGEENKEKVHFFILQIVDSFMYQTKIQDVGIWLEDSVKKPIDSSFFLMLEPLFIEQFKRFKLGLVFIRNAEMKIQWLKNQFNIIAGADQVLERIDELLLSMKNWIDGMIAQKQLTKQQLQKINQIQNISFLKYFIYNVLTPDMFNNSDINFMINTFQTSSDAVLFQLKGLKRILLLMRFKPTDAYEIAEMLIKTFNEAFHCQTTY